MGKKRNSETGRSKPQETRNTKSKGARSPAAETREPAASGKAAPAEPPPNLGSEGASKRSAPSSGKSEPKRSSRARGSKGSPVPPKETPVPARAPGFPVVGIGASAGGLEALDELFENMPPDTGMAFVVVTHQHPGHASLLPELLAKETAMEVVEAEEGMRLEPNRVYVGPPGAHLTVSKRTLHRQETANAEAPKLPIDHFFRSLAEDQKDRAICIVLSGTGTDGTLGLKAIKGELGMATVQEPQSAKYAGMPSSAIATGLADYVLPPARMPARLVEYARGSYLSAAAFPDELPSVPPEPLQRIFALLRGRTGNDFSSYKANTIRRRIERRMNVHSIKRPNEYVRYLQDNPREIDILFKELLIGVTNFFRDPEAWEAFGAELERSMAALPDNHVFRVWAPGCATGEEAYSVAMLVRERMEKLKRRFDVQIFGTDLDSEAIDAARAGVYPDGIAVDVSPSRLERFFVREDGFYRVRKEIREMVVFAPQNAIKDPPFTKLDALTCRNLLIYLNADLQRKLLPIFHYALKPGGVLFLGPSETVGTLADLFQPADKRWKVFRRTESASAPRSMPEIPAQRVVREAEATPAKPTLPSGRELRVATLVERFLLNRFAPACVVVNERGDIVFIHGRTGAYFEPAPGEPHHNAIEMGREGLRIELAAALRECARKGGDVVREGVRVKTNGDYALVDLSVSRIAEPEAIRGMMLVSFRPTPSDAEGPARPPRHSRKKTVDGDRVVQLERELQYMKESHQTTLEELETSNEELKSTNEELQSTNEELQSTNEELETSKEEMQSLNEELTTVNAEMQSKVDELSQSNDDMQNLLNSTDVATIFLDNELNIKRFTEQAKDLVTLRTTDVGRPISELASNVAARDLAEDCRAVLRSLVFKEAEIRTVEGRVYLMRIMPYRTAENVIDGVVLTFVDISRLRQAEEAGRLAKQYFESIVDAVREPLVVLDGDLRVVSANRSFYRTFRTGPKQTEGELIYELGAGQWDVPKLRRLLEEILPGNAQFDDYEVEAQIPKLGRRLFILNARRMERPEGAGALILLALEDATKP